MKLSENIEAEKLLMMFIKEGYTESPTEKDRKDTLELYFMLHDTLNECDSDD